MKLEYDFQNYEITVEIEDKRRVMTFDSKEEMMAYSPALILEGTLHCIFNGYI